jgi:hypothetical protein
MTSRTNLTAKQSPEAVASMAGIGRSIDQAIGRLSPPALGLPTIQIVSRSDDTDRGRGSGSAPPQIEKSLIDLPAAPAVSAPPAPPAESAPPQRSAPPLPRLKPLRKEADAIEKAIQQATKARELAGVDGNIREGVRAIEKVGRSFDRMNNPLTDGVMESERPTVRSRIADSARVGGFVGSGVARASGFLPGIVAGAGTTAGVFGGYLLYDELNPDPFTMADISRQDLTGWKRWAEKALSTGSELSPEARAFLFQEFQAAWINWSSFLEELVKNIESPDTSPEAAALRSDSLEILPKIISDAEEGLEWYGKLLPDDVQNWNRAILDHAIRLGDEADYSGSPSQDRDYASNPGQRSHHPIVSPDVSPAAFGYKSSLAQESALQAASYRMPLSFSSPPAESGRFAQPETAARVTLEQLMERMLDRLNQPLRLDPVRLEVRVLDDRVIARRLDGNRSVDVDLSRGYRMVGYISV